MQGQRDNWKVLKKLGSGGQGEVSLVVENGKNILDRSLVPLGALIKQTTNEHAPVEEFKRQFWEVVLDCIDGKYAFGALKVLKEPTEEALSRLEREAGVYEAIDDPHLLKILDKNIPESWIVTEYQLNGTLEARLGDYRGNAASALLAIRPLVAVLAKMHTAQFVHRDFKPGNIFIGRKEQLILGDAGLAFCLDDRGARATNTYENVGTRDYMPGWAYSRRSEINPKFDVFSVGKVIWAMIAGEPTCSLWYVFKQKNDLVIRFPSRTEMLWVNDLLSKCVVEEEEQMKISDGVGLLKEIDAILESINMRAITPDHVLTVLSCRICSVGKYKKDNSGQRGAIVYSSGTCFKCDRCGHLEFFARGNMDQTEYEIVRGDNDGRPVIGLHRERALWEVLAKPETGFGSEAEAWNYWRSIGQPRPE